VHYLFTTVATEGKTGAALQRNTQNLQEGFQERIYNENTT